MSPGQGRVAIDLKVRVVVGSKHREEGGCRRVILEVGRYVSNDDALRWVERPSRKFPPREFGADRIPPVFPRRLLSRKVRLGKKVQVENFVPDRLFAIRFDLDRPIEMLDCCGSVS